MNRRPLAALALSAAGLLACADGAALQRGLRGERAPVIDAGPDRALDAAPVDASPPDQAAPDARPPRDARPPPDAGPPDAAPPDMGPDPRCVEEICNDADDDCDGSVDEGVADCCEPGTRRDCGTALGQCTMGEQFCTIDLEWSACTGDPPGREICDGAADEDCDGRVDEGLLNACGACGAAPEEICNAVDDDCDGATDEGLLNACGACGPLPEEMCNAVDDDCDGDTDEGVLNACGACGPLPDERCNTRDDDCDGAIDEGVLNACGACGDVPAERCNGVDDDCDAQVDEAACYAFVLDDADNRWRAPPGLNDHPLLAEGGITALFATVAGGERFWGIAGGDLYVYEVAADRWLPDPVRDAFGVERVDAAYAVPAWWDQAGGGRASLTLTTGDTYRVFTLDPISRARQFVRLGSHAEGWAADPRAPRDFPLEATVVDLFDARDYWPGDARATCGGDAQAGPVAGVLEGGRVFTTDAGTCFRFMDRRPAGDWAGFRVANAPPPQDIIAWDFLNRPTRTGAHVVIVRRPADGR